MKAVFGNRGLSPINPPAAAIYIHGPGTDEPLMRQTGNGPGSPAGYYHHDGLGSVIAMTNAAGTITGSQRFDAWGNDGGATGAIQQYGYTGREPDGTGLIYYRARYYDPTIGRFLQKDPIGLQGGLNQYAYVANNPINLVDPLGLAASPLASQLVATSRSYAAANADDGANDAGNGEGFYLAQFVVPPRFVNPIGNAPAGGFNSANQSLKTQNSDNEILNQSGQGGSSRGGSGFDASGSPGNCNPLDPACGSKEPPQVRQNYESGRAFEEQVRTALNQSKNNQTLYGNSPNRGTVPDFKGAVGITDAKNVVNLTDSIQLRIQYQWAVNNDQAFNLIVSPRTESISRTVVQNVRATGGTIRVFNPSTGTFRVW
jgi:RHS repeat-associated protein